MRSEEGRPLSFAPWGRTFHQDRELASRIPREWRSAPARIRPRHSQTIQNRVDGIPDLSENVGRHVHQAMRPVVYEPLTDATTPRPIDRAAEYLQPTEEILSHALRGNFTNPVFDTERDLENGASTIDREGFPAWAQDRYDVCVHWTVPFWTEVYNNDRRPGNSSAFIQQSAEGRGWILIGEKDANILKLGYRLLREGSEPVILIDVWDSPG